MITLHHGDCLAVLPTLADASVDAVVTDPPGGISFMGKSWDSDRGGRRQWIDWLSSVLAECLRVAKPGSVLLCWAIPRTSHWTGTAIEDAGWQIQDRLAHIFGSGFPKHKSHLKPAVEDWWLARKPGPKWLGVEATRVEAAIGDYNHPGNHNEVDSSGTGWGTIRSGRQIEPHPSGRWPANLLLSHSPLCNGTCHESCPIRLMGEQGGERTVSGSARNGRPATSISDGDRHAYSSGLGKQGRLHNDSGSAARFFPNFDAEPYDPLFYCPKASRKDRNAGCEGMEERAEHRYADGNGFAGRTQNEDGEWINTDHANRKPTANHHPTVKPTELMRWLCRLACPPGGTILDPFLGSGSTGRGAVLEGFDFVGIEREEEYLRIAEARIAEARAGLPLFGGAAV